MSLTDTQSELDHRRLPIERVGVRGVQFPLSIADRELRPQHTVATVSMAVDLPHQYKGTHMSRFMQVLHSHGSELTVANAAAIPRELLNRLEARRAHLELRFPYFRSKAAPVTGTQGLLDYGVLFEDGEDAGLALRGTFVIDKKGNVRHATLNDLPLGRNIDEYLRLIDAIEFNEKHGEVCPANWHAGDEGMKADPTGSQSYFQKHG